MRHQLDPWIDAFGSARICGALAPLLSDERMARIEAVLALRLASLTAIVEDTYDPHNAAATLRTAEALGLSELHVAAPQAGFRAKGVTRGTDRWLDVWVWGSFVEAAAALEQRGFAVVATTPDAEHDLATLDLSRPIAVAFGNEHHGLSARALASCSHTVRIPMFGFAESYNLSVSVALALSQLGARRRSALGGGGDLPTERKERLRARWYGQGQRGVHQILERALGALPSQERVGAELPEPEPQGSSGSPPSSG